jgi:hypothetical protein
LQFSSCKIDSTEVRKTTMMIKYALCGIVLAAFVTPALAANKFYVVRDTTTKECSIVEQKPTEATMKAGRYGPQVPSQGRSGNES